MMITFLLFGVAFARKLDSRAPDVLYQTLIRKHVQIGSTVSGLIVANEWTDGPDQDDCAKGVPETLMSTKPTYGWAPEPPVLVCDSLPSDFTLQAQVKLKWSYSESALDEKLVQFSPNSGEPPVPFSFDIPENVKTFKSRDYDSLIVEFQTLLANGTEFGLKSTEYLTLIEREALVIQSDKAKYKPGNAVNFRILLTDINLKPIQAEKLRYTVTSPSDNKMAQKTLKDVNAVHVGKFMLDKYAEEGQWRIEATASAGSMSIEKTYEFTVEKYVLPTFEVKIQTDRGFVIADDEDDIPFKLDAIYTFGQPVKGSATVKITKMPCTFPSWRQPVLPPPCPPFQSCPEYDDNGCVVPPDMTLEVKKFSGSYSETISRTDLKKIYDFEDENWQCKCSRNLLITASVTDGASGEELGAEKKLNVEDEKYTLNFVYEPDARREGIPYEYIAQVKYIDGSVIDAEGQVECKVADTTYGDSKLKNSIVTKDLRLEDNGYFTCRIPDVYTQFQLTISFTDTDGKRAESSRYVYQNKPESNELITIKSGVNDRKLVPGETLDLTIKSNYDATLNVAAIAKNEIVSTQLVKVQKDTEQVFQLEITYAMVPEVRFIAYENRGTHWNADSLSFFIREDFEHMINLVPSKNETKVGESVSLGVKSNKPGAEVFVLGVDKSVRLLAQGNDVTKQKFLEVMQESQESSWRPWPIWGGCGIWFPWSYGSTSRSKLSDAGYSLVDVKSYEGRRRRPYFRGGLRKGGFMPPSRRMDPRMKLFERKSAKEDAGGSGSEAEIKTRQNFPETWLWESVTTDSEGNAAFDELTVPDTITSWIITGFGVSETAGFGLADETSILAFQDFFIKLRLPYSIKQGEDFVLKAVVYNYLATDAKTKIRLKPHESFSVELGSDQTVTIPARDTYTVTWVIKATVSGVIPINVRAVVDNNLAGDEIERLLIVKPEGLPVASFTNALLENTDEIETKLDFPDNVVKGSKRVELRVFGDVLANTIENVDELLKMPYGCGEQNMYNFAPAVFIYDYLRKTGELTEALETKALNIIQTGYQRELTYRHQSGGYSAFGENSYSKAEASTVLTSFVLKELLV